MRARRRARVPAGVAALAAAVVAATTLLWPVAAGAAAPAQGLALGGIRAEAGRLTALLTPVHVTAGSTVDLSGLTVRAGDLELPAHVAPATDLTGAPSRVFLIVLDGSQPAASYAASLRAAAGSVAAALPPDVALGLVVTGPDGIAQPLAPTVDRAAFSAAVAAAVLGGHEDAVDALDAARQALVDMASPWADARILLVSNGASTSATARSSGMGTSVASAGIGLDVVAIGAQGTGLTGLRLMADAAGGRIYTAGDEASVAAAARESAGLLVPSMTLTASVPGALSGVTALVTVEAPGFEPVSASAAFPTWDVGALPEAPAAFSWVPGWLVYVVALCFFAAVVFAVLALAWPRSESHSLIKKIAHFGPRRSVPKPAPATSDNAMPTAMLTRKVLAATARLLRAGGLEERIALRLERGGMKIRPHEWVALRVGIAVGAAVLFALAAGLEGLILGLAVGVLGTMAYQMNRISRRERQFTEQLPDALQLVIGSLRSGFSLSQALESLVREAPEPLAAEVGRAVAEHRLGADLSDALDRLAARVGSDDLNWAVMSVRIQRDVGGNLADVLQTSVDTMRERDRLRRHVRALSAEGRLSAWVLVAVPVVLATFLAAYRRSYLAPLVTDPRGILMLIVGIALFAVGIFWLTRIVKVEA
ncbi:MAG TPA: type II secretion system F family protein [Micromonosporaceae bacterium]|nr:type II secretion system F family protein [Micromonosporaceae bacterium]